MLVVNKRDEGLLKMKASEFMIGNDKENALREYKELVIKVDRELYNELIELIKNTDINNLSLEDQMKALNEILEAYQFVCEKQIEYKNIYQEGYKLVYGVSEDDLVLSDLSDILIDNIRNRFMAVQGFLINSKNIRENQLELEKLNQDLIDENKRKDGLTAEYKKLEAELKNGFLTAIGRNYKDNGDLEPNSVVKEYSNLGLNLEELFEKPDLLEAQLSEAQKERNSLDESLLAVETCYDLTPTEENREIFAEAIRDAARATYKLVLLSMADLVSHEETEYSSIVLKRKQILALNTERLKCLDALGVRIAFDPFVKMRVSEQLTNIETLGDNDADIERITRNIGNLDRLVETRTNENKEYEIELGRVIVLLKEEEIPLEVAVDTVSQRMPADNKVTNITDRNPNMDMDRVGEQTQGVIERALAFYDKDEAPVEERIPELVIAPAYEEEQYDELSKGGEKEDAVAPQEETREEVSNTGMPILFEDANTETEGIFSSQEVKPDEMPELFADVTEKLGEVFPEDEISQSEEKGALELSKDDSVGTGAVFVDNPSGVYADVFDDHDKPFVEEAPLFSERADAEEVKETSKDAPVEKTTAEKTQPEEAQANQLPPMPEAFWTTATATDDGGSGLAPQGGATIDEQVAALGIDAGAKAPAPKIKKLGMGNGG